MIDEQFYDHYKDTCQITREAEAKRGNLLLLLLGMIALMFLQILQPEAVVSTLSSFLQNSIGSKLEFSISVIQTLIWIAVLLIIISYFKVCVNIERSYAYIHEIERKLSKSGEIPVEREGRAYLEDYPLYSKWIYLLFTWILPIGLGIILIAKNVIEYIGEIYDWQFLMINTVILFFCLLSIIFYLIMIHSKKSTC